MHRSARLLAFWGAVAGVSILADVCFNIAADRLGGKVPSLLTLNNYRTRRNG